MEKTYICVDLKSFYASVECCERGLNPLTTNLVVADKSRTDKTICLAVSPSLKQYGLSGRSRLYEVVSKVNEINSERRKATKLVGKSFDDLELKKNKSLKLDYIVAPPRMNYYMKYSTNIYSIYLKYFAPEDIYVYSIDEVFCDITNYLKLYNKNPKEIVTMVINDIYTTTGITATGGIGTNMFLAKVAMDVVAKHVDADDKGVRIAELDEKRYREIIWSHEPITDIWNVGKGIAKKLKEHGIYTMGDVARCSLENDNLLYNLFGVNAELLIDHAWGYEPVTIKDIKSYRPSSTSLSMGQVLHEPYNYSKGRLIVKEMIDMLVLDLVNKNLMTNQLTLTIGYDISNLTNPKIAKNYYGEIVTDYYGRKIPKHSHGTTNLEYKTLSSKIITRAVVDLYDRITNPTLLIRRINISANKLEKYSEKKENYYKQFDLFSDTVEEDLNKRKELEKEKDELKIQKAIIDIKNKYGKNYILKGMNLMDGATAMDRNKQIGGHHE